jgi:hypothetical protein
MNDKLEKMWREAIMAYFKVLLCNSRGVTEDNHD